MGGGATREVNHHSVRRRPLLLCALRIIIPRTTEGSEAEPQRFTMARSRSGISPIFSENPALFPSFPENSQNLKLTIFSNFLTEFPDFLTNIQDFLTQHFILDFQSFMDYLCLRNL